MANIRVALADDHKIVRDGIKLMIRQHPGVEVIAEAENGKEVIDLCAKENIDLVIMDINMPQMDGIEATNRIKINYPEIKVLALTMSNDDVHIRKMIQAGASGYIMKSSGTVELREAIDTIMNGKHYFSDEATKSIMMDLVKNKGVTKSDEPVSITEREVEILELIVKEFTNQEIADKLFISPRTVDAHRRNLLQKTGARNTAGLVRYALTHNFFSDEK